MGRFRGTLLASSMLALMAACPAMAQDAATAEPQDPAATKTDPQAAESGDNIVVTGLRESLRSARQAKQKSDAILDTVVAEDIGQLPDNSATEALARLPGVQIFRNRGEGQSITVRGLSQVLTTLNGQEAYTGSSRRSLLNSYPAGLLRSVTVYKALTPDLVEGGIGGAIDIQLRQPFDFRPDLVVAGTLRGSYDDQAKKVFYNGDILLSDRWDTGIGEMGLLLNLSYLRRDYFESYRENGQPQNSTATQSISPTGLGTIRYPTSILVKQPNGHYTRPVATASFQWKPATNLRVDMRVTNIWDRNTNYDADLTTAIANTTALTNVVLVPDTNVVKSATFTPTGLVGTRSSHTGNDINTTQAEFGVHYDVGRARLSTNLVYTHSDQRTETQLFLLAFNSNQQINAVFQSDSKFGGLSYNYTSADITNPASFHVRAYSDALSKAKANGVQWRTDLELDTDTKWLPLIKTGFRYATRSTRFQSGSRLADLNALNLPLSAFPGGNTPEIFGPGLRGDDASVPSRWVQYDGHLLGDPANYAALNRYVSTLAGQAALFTPERPSFDPLLAFSGREQSYAVYGQAKYNLDLGAVTIDGIVGARIVNTKLDIDGTRRTTSRVGTVTTVTFSPINGRQNYVDVDPSVSAVAHFGRNVQLRAAWTKTFTRPDFSQLNPSLNLAEVTAASGAITSAATGGNPDLRPIRSTNWDTSLEWYFGRAGFVSVAGFKRDVNGFFINAVSPELLPGAAAATTNVTRPINAGDGTIKGFELSASSFLDFMPGALRNFGGSINFTYIDTDQDLRSATSAALVRGPITGISKTSVNSALFYDDGKFRARVAYSVRSRFILAYVLTAPDSNLDWYPISRLDASMSYRLNPNVTFTLDGQNLLGKPQRAFWGNTALSDSSFDDRVYFEGRVVSAAVRFKF